MRESGTFYEPEISFIVPVYNTAQFLPRCIDSLLAQSRTSIEIFLIDDGSTDTSFEICSVYAARHSFITAITKKNEGQGVARNLGISQARGRLIAFVDSDDWIDSAYCAEVLRAFADPSIDFVNFGLEYRSASGLLVHSIVPQALKMMEGRAVFHNALIVNGVLSSPCTKVYRRNFLLDNQLAFPAIRANEDIIFATLVGRAAKKTLLMPKILYFAMVRPGSTSRAMGLNNFLATEQLIALEKTAFAPELQDPETKRYFDAHVLKVFTFILFQGAVRLQTKQEMQAAFECADRCGLAMVSRNRGALATLPLKNRMMARATRWRRSFRLVVRILDKVGLGSY